MTGVNTARLFQHLKVLLLVSVLDQFFFSWRVFNNGKSGANNLCKGVGDTFALMLVLMLLFCIKDMSLMQTFSIVLSRFECHIAIIVLLST